MLDLHSLFLMLQFAAPEYPSPRTSNLEHIVVCFSAIKQYQTFFFLSENRYIQNSYLEHIIHSLPVASLEHPSPEPAAAASPTSRPQPPPSRNDNTSVRNLGTPLRDYNCESIATVLLTPF